jgi:hypothetical protein
MENKNLRFGTFFWRVSSSHIITYFVMGIIASSLLNYEEAFANPPLSYLMKPIDSSWVAIGPVLQIFRGLVFSIALWLFKDSFLFKEYGWAKLWFIIICLSILSTTGPTPGSIEGLIYTNISVISQMEGYFEVLPQTLLFSLFVFYWYNQPKRLWNILSIILVSLIVILCTLGLLASYQKI